MQSKSSATLVLESGSRSTTVFLPARLVAGPSDNLLVPVELGVGISALPEIQVATQLRRGDLVRVLPEWSIPAFSVQILYPAQARLAAATRRVMEFLVTRIPERVTELLAAD